MADNHEHPSSLTRKLRYTTILTFIPALILCLVHGIVFNCALPAVGLLPAAGSFVLALYDLGFLDKLFNKHDYQIVIGDDNDGKQPSARRKLIVAIIDAILGLGLVACIITGLLMVVGRTSSYWWGGAVDGIIASYATMPLWVNAFIHGFFVLLYLYSLLPSNRPKTRVVCPHCAASFGGESSPQGPPLGRTPRMAVRPQPGRDEESV